MPNAAIFHFDHQVVTLDEDNLTALDGNLLGSRPGCCGLLRLYLRERRHCKGDAGYSHRKYRPYFHPTAS
jgi:hypothetical protein